MYVPDFTVLLLVFVVAVAAAPPPINKYSADDDDVQVLKYENYNTGVDNHKYTYETSDGTEQEQEGKLKNEGHEDEANTFRGSFVWISPEGIRYEVNYVADKNEYQPEFDEAPGVPSPNIMALMVG